MSHHDTSEYPHLGGCNDCRAARVCNVCGKPLDAGRCTNGRCGRCHEIICTPGGNTEPGHGYGDAPTQGGAVMREWIFTFGFGHTHPDTGESLASCFIRIPALDAEDARAAMVRRFGLKWAFQYEDADKAGVVKYGLREITDRPRSALGAFAMNLPQAPEAQKKVEGAA